MIQSNGNLRTDVYDFELSPLQIYPKQGIELFLEKSSQ